MLLVTPRYILTPLRKGVGLGLFNDQFQLFEVVPIIDGDTIK